MQLYSMDRLISLILFVLSAAPTHACIAGNAHKVAYPGGKTYMYRVMLKDKHGTPFSTPLVAGTARQETYNIH